LGLVHPPHGGSLALTAELAAALGLDESQAGPLPARNIGNDELVLRIAAALGARRAMLAGATNPALAEQLWGLAVLGSNAALRLGELVRPRAIRVPWTLTPSERMARATALFRNGVPPNRLLPMAACLAAVRQALSPEREADCAIPSGWSDLFAEDRARLCEQGFVPRFA
jgi:hypothetical protein